MAFPLLPSRANPRIAPISLAVNPEREASETPRLFGLMKPRISCLNAFSIFIPEPVEPARSRIKGWFSDTLNKETVVRHGIADASVIMVDADIYTSSKQALDFCAPLIQREAVLVMDDWYAGNRSFVERNMGQPRALKEFLAENPNFQTADVGPYSFFGRLAGHVFTLKRIGIAVIAALTLSSFDVQIPNEETEERDRVLAAARFAPA